MLFHSTRDLNNKKTVSQAILQGLSKEGGLFVPEHFPQIDWKNLDTKLSYPEFAAKILADYFSGDELAPQLVDICKNAFNFPLPIEKLNDNTYIMELFQGPTLSFKDFGARFLAECMTRLSKNRKTTIIVATSGDTGSAVASAFHQKNNVDVVVMFPNGQISKRQEAQITCWGDNILAVAVKGTFDDCQKIVKAAFSDSWWSNRAHLSSANSINIARLLPQLTYYAYTSWQFYLNHGEAAGYVIPTGNVGNSTAAYWAKAMGFPIREIVLATNANRVISDYITNGKFEPKSSVATIANAMDVGNPSNFERLSFLHHNNWQEFTQNVQAFSVNDEQIREIIKEVYDEFNYIVCPHTATGYFARKQLNDKPWIIAATAAPCKFETIIEPLIGETLPVATQLQALLDMPVHRVETNAEMKEVQAAFANNCK
jgi:threonine synthase